MDKTPLCSNAIPKGRAARSSFRGPIRKRIEERAPQPSRSTTSVDLPLSQDSKRALVYADEESKTLEHTSIDCCHFLLGLLRIENSTAAILLREFGIEHAGYRKLADGPSD